VGRLGLRQLFRLIRSPVIVGSASASFQHGAGHDWSEIADVLWLTAAGISSRNIALSLSIGAIDFLERARTDGARKQTSSRYVG
jgi:hypothetical protein